MFELRVESVTGSLRRGTLQTPHGSLATPFFMPIATKGVVKTLSSFDLERLQTPIILSNAYHLWLRPGLDVLRAAGGLHRFMHWDGAILTDSGGFQVFSLSGLRKLTNEGVAFRSHIDGAKMMLTPEICMEIQRVIGSDICMVLDVCTALPASPSDVRRAHELTIAWAKRSKQAFTQTRDESLNPGALLFGIVQGGVDIELRKRSATELVDIGFDGYAIGGLSVGEPFEDACRVLEQLDKILPRDRPRYFMGGAQPHEIVAYASLGVDLFDCVLPTRNARHGLLYRFVHDDLSQPDFYETIHVTNERFAQSRDLLITDSFGVHLEDELGRYTLGYVRHLFRIEETLGQRLVTLANVRFYLELMRRLREGKRCAFSSRSAQSEP